MLTSGLVNKAGGEECVIRAPSWERCCHARDHDATPPGERARPPRTHNSPRSSVQSFGQGGQYPWQHSLQNHQLSAPGPRADRGAEVNIRVLPNEGQPCFWSVPRGREVRMELGRAGPGRRCGRQSEQATEDGASAAPWVALESRIPDMEALKGQTRFVSCIQSV